MLVPGPVDAQGVREILSRAISDFDRGRLEASAAGFDRVAELAPDVAPQLWQRGIALYYVGRYRDCREQFESHRTVNPNDVENAAWHFLCVAREESPASALAALLPVGPDPRAPMTEIYRMFRGEVTPEAVLAAGEQGGERGRFYAHLYVGLYHEAFGRAGHARTHITVAADERFAAVGGYMQMVARVHRIELDRAR
jgi:tetratricopeptide (TPR) repeat protein